MRKLRLAFICHDYPPSGGGAATALERLTRQLRAHGHEIQIVTIATPGQPLSEHDRHGRWIVRLQAGRTSPHFLGYLELARSFLALRYLGIRHLRSFDPQVLVGFFAFPGGHAACYLAKRLRLPFVVSLRGSDVPEFYPQRWGIFQPLQPLLIRPVLRNASRVMANGRHLVELAAAFMPGLEISNLPNGIDTHWFTPDPQLLAPAPGLPPPTPPAILYVGQMSSRKSILEVAASIKWLAMEGIACSVTMVGSGPLLPRVKEQLSALTGRVQVSFREQIAREEMPELYRQHSILINLSTAEGISNVILEAMASGLAVVATRAAAGPDLIHVPGIVFTHSNRPEEIGPTLSHLVRDYDHLLKLRRAARKSAECFNWDHTVERFLEQIKDLVPPEAR